MGAVVNRWVAIACAAMMIVLFVMARWQSGKIDDLKAERDSLSDKLSARQVVFDTHLKLTAVMNGISQINISQREQTAKDTEEVKTIIKTVLWAMTALMLMSPLAILTSCADSETVKYIPVAPPMPPQLTADCPVSYVPGKMTWSQLAELQVETMSALIQCNHDKQDDSVLRISRDGTG